MIDTDIPEPEDEINKGYSMVELFKILIKYDLLEMLGMGFGIFSFLIKDIKALEILISVFGALGFLNLIFKDVIKYNKKH
jgi:hypothetical protein